MPPAGIPLESPHPRRALRLVSSTDPPPLDCVAESGLYQGKLGSGYWDRGVAARCHARAAISASTAPGISRRPIEAMPRSATIQTSASPATNSLRLWTHAPTAMRTAPTSGMKKMGKNPRACTPVPNVHALAGVFPDWHPPPAVEMVGPNASHITAAIVSPAASTGRVRRIASDHRPHFPETPNPACGSSLTRRCLETMSLPCPLVSDRVTDCGH